MVFSEKIYDLKGFILLVDGLEYILALPGRDFSILRPWVPFPAESLNHNINNPIQVLCQFIQIDRDLNDAFSFRLIHHNTSLRHEVPIIVSFDLEKFLIGTFFDFVFPL